MNTHKNKEGHTNKNNMYTDRRNKNVSKKTGNRKDYKQAVRKKENYEKNQESYKENRKNKRTTITIAITG